MRNEISNSDNIIDSRDVIKRIEELESERDSWQEDNELPDYIDPETTTNDKIKEWTDEQFEKWAEWEESPEGEELKALLELQDQAEGYSDWIYGATLIRDSYFKKYAEEDIKERYGLPRDLPPIIANNIDWQGVADDLQQDYTSVDFDGVEYWIR